MIGTRIHGIPQLKRKLRQIERDVNRASPKAVAAGGGAFLQMARLKAPKRTGRLAAGIRIDVEDQLDGAVAHVGTDVPYDRFVQLGTRYMDAQPYAEDAAEASEGGITAAMAVVYKAALPHG